MYIRNIALTALLSVATTGCAATYKAPTSSKNAAVVSGSNWDNAHDTGVTYLAEIDGHTTDLYSLTTIRATMSHRVAPGKHTFGVQSRFREQGFLKPWYEGYTIITANVLPNHHYRFVGSVTSSSFHSAVTLSLVDQNGQVVARSN